MNQAAEATPHFQAPFLSSADIIFLQLLLFVVAVMVAVRVKKRLPESWFIPLFIFAGLFVYGILVAVDNACAGSGYLGMHASIGIFWIIPTLIFEAFVLDKLESRQVKDQEAGPSFN